MSMVWTLSDSILSPQQHSLLVTFKKINQNPILVNINKLKLYRILDVVFRRLEATTKRGEKTQWKYPIKIQFWNTTLIINT